MWSALDPWAASSALMHPLSGHLGLGTFIRPVRSVRQEMSSSFLCPHPQPAAPAPGPGQAREGRKARSHPQEQAALSKPHPPPSQHVTAFNCPGLRRGVLTRRTTPVRSHPLSAVLLWGLQEGCAQAHPLLCLCPHSSSSLDPSCEMTPECQLLKDRFRAKDPLVSTSPDRIFSPHPPQPPKASPPSLHPALGAL